MLAAIPLFLLTLAALAWVLEGGSGPAAVDPTDYIERFFPPHRRGAGPDPLEAVESFLARLMDVARRLSIVAVPAFLWLSTRLFAGIRISLNEIYDVSVRPVRRHFVLAYLGGKLRDLGMVLVTLVLFLANASISAGLLLLQARGEAAVPALSFFVSTLGRLAGQALAFFFIVSLFFVLYHFASKRRPPWRASLVASFVAAVLFELAKWLFSLYLRNAASNRFAAVDVNVGAVILFILWVYYSALVFLLGGVIAETWELRDLQRKQRMAVR